MDLELEVGERSNQGLKDGDSDILDMLNISVCISGCECVSECEYKCEYKCECKYKSECEY